VEGSSLYPSCARRRAASSSDKPVMASIGTLRFTSCSSRERSFTARHGSRYVRLVDLGVFFKHRPLGMWP
jgi:hypothetical protein